jgi:hypothetical protein
MSVRTDLHHGVCLAGQRAKSGEASGCGGSSSGEATLAGCCLQAWLSHTSRALERSPTSMVDAMPTAPAARRINVGDAAVVGQIDNERPSSRTYATATGESESGDPEVPGATEPISVLTRPCPNERVEGAGRSGFNTRIARAPSGLA